MQNKYQEALDKLCNRCFSDEPKKVLQELIDKEKQLTMNYIADGYADGYPVYDTVQCPNCAMTFEMEEVDIKQYKYCPYCGQHWNEIKLDYGLNYGEEDE